jgi:uncharacterized protein (DUF2336 family)
MSQALQIIDELEVALKSNSTERHHAILKSVTDLFLAGCDRMTEEISSLFDDVIVRLVDHVESRARVELSQDVAPIANAPSNVIRRLARVSSKCRVRKRFFSDAEFAGLPSIAIETLPELHKKPRQ